jgi:hypothetical protein
VCRLTPRCSGQYPGVRPGIAAELKHRWATPGPGKLIIVSSSTIAPERDQEESGLGAATPTSETSATQGGLARVCDARTSVMSVGATGCAGGAPAKAGGARAVTCPASLGASSHKEHAPRLRSAGHKSHRTSEGAFAPSLRPTTLHRLSFPADNSSLVAWGCSASARSTRLYSPGVSFGQQHRVCRGLAPLRAVSPNPSLQRTIPGRSPGYCR